MNYKKVSLFFVMIGLVFSFVGAVVDNNLSVGDSEISQSERFDFRVVDSFGEGVVRGDGEGLIRESVSSDDMVVESLGYIVEFEEEPILKKKAELEKKVEENSGGFFERSGISNVPVIRSFAPATPSNFENKLEKHKEKVDREHEKVVNRIFDLGDVRTSPGEDVVLGEYKNTFNGIALDVSSEKAAEIEEVKGVKKVWKNNKVEILLDESVPLIQGGIGAGQLDENGEDCLSTGKKCLTGEGVSIGIIDTGVDYTHGDLGGCTTEEFLGRNCGKVVGGYDFSGNFQVFYLFNIISDNDPMDYMGHGTHVAATAAGDGVLKGVAPGADIYAYKVFPNSYGSVIISAIERSVDPNQDGDTSDHLDVISLSLGGVGTPDDPMSQAIDNVVDTGVVAVISAGNSGSNYGMYDAYIPKIGSPGTARNAITIAASNKIKDEERNIELIVPFSSEGPVIWEDENFNVNIILKPDVAAPGVNICAAQWGNAWESSKCLDDEHVAISGTSMAAPHISGVVALILEKHPDWSPEEVKKVLKKTATKIGFSVNSVGQGFGRVNVTEAIKLESLSVFVKLDSISRPFGTLDITGSVDGENLDYYEIYLNEGLGTKNGVSYFDPYTYEGPGDWQTHNPSWNLIKTEKIESGIKSFGEIDARDMTNHAVYSIKLIVYDNLGNSDEDIIYLMPQNVILNNPNQDSIFEGNQVIPITGKAFFKDFQEYSIYYRNEETGEISDAGINLIDEGKKEVAGILGYLDTSKLERGVYTLFLKVNGNEEIIVFSDFIVEPSLNKVIQIHNIFRGPYRGAAFYLIPHPSIGDLNEDGKLDFVIPYMAQVNVFDVEGNLPGWPYVGDGELYGGHPLVSSFFNGDKFITFSDTLGQVNFFNLKGEKIKSKFSYLWSVSHADMDKTIQGNEIIISDFRDRSLDIFNEEDVSIDNWPLYFDGEFFFGKQAIGDINNDGSLDVVVKNTETGDIFAYDYKKNLIFHSDFKKPGINGGHIWLADLNNDSNLEIISFSVSSFIGGTDTLAVLDNNGNYLWSIDIYNAHIWYYSPLAFGDVTGDGNFEIIYSQYSYDYSKKELFSRILVFNYKGEVIRTIPTTLFYASSYPSTYDLNGDGKDEIIYLDRKFWANPEEEVSYADVIKAIDIDGTIYFEKYIPPQDFDAMGSLTTTRPLVRDIDGDGKVEIALVQLRLIQLGTFELSRDMSYYLGIYDTDFDDDPKKLRFDLNYVDTQHTGCYDCDFVEGGDEIPIVEDKCFSSDGLDSGVAGYTEYDGERFEDSCVGEGQVEEYYCKFNLWKFSREVESKVLDCEFSCVEGACVGQDENEKVYRECVDDSPLNELEVKGVVEFKGEVYEDVCEEEGLSVREYQCVNDKLRSFVKRCSDGESCFDGKCS